MYSDWKIFIKPYVSTEEYIPDNTNSKKLSSLVFFVILGFITSFNLMARVEKNIDNGSIKNPVMLKIQQVRKNIDNIEAKNTILESEIFILNHNITQMLESREKQEILKLSKLTGSNKKIGSGVIIRLLDSDKPLQQDENPNLGIIHNTDLVELINELWTGHAQAISVNNERITEKTAISCVGPAILVNKTRIVPPFIIRAVGNPETLMNTVKKGHIQSLELSGIKYSIEKYDRLEIPADGTIILAGDF